MKIKKYAALLAAPVLAAFILPANALSFDKGIFIVRDSSFTVGEMSEYVLGSDPGQPGSDVMEIPGGDPVTEDYKTALRQNGELWHAVDEVKVKFVLNITGDTETADLDGFFAQGVFQLGEASGWAWADSDNKPDMVSLEPDYSQSGFKFGEEYTLTYHPKAFMDSSGASPDSKGGVLRMGLKIGNQGIDSLDLNVEFKDVTISGNQTVIDKYSALADELTVKIEPIAETPENIQPIANPETGTTTNIAAFTALGLSAAAIAFFCIKKRK